MDDEGGFHPYRGEAPSAPKAPEQLAKRRRFPSPARAGLFVALVLLTVASWASFPRLAQTGLTLLAPALTIVVARAALRFLAKLELAAHVTAHPTGLEVMWIEVRDLQRPWEGYAALDVEAFQRREFWSWAQLAAVHSEAAPSRLQLFAREQVVIVERDGRRTSVPVSEFKEGARELREAIYRAWESFDPRPRQARLELAELWRERFELPVTLDMAPELPGSLLPLTVGGAFALVALVCRSQPHTPWLLTACCLAVATVLMVATWPAPIIDKLELWKGGLTVHRKGKPSYQVAWENVRCVRSGLSATTTPQRATKIELRGRRDLWLFEHRAGSLDTVELLLTRNIGALAMGAHDPNAAP